MRGDRAVVDLVAVELRSILEDVLRDRGVNDLRRIVDLDEDAREEVPRLPQCPVLDDQVVASRPHDAPGLVVVARDDLVAFHASPIPPGVSC